MKVKRKRVQLIERLANYYRHSRINRAKDRHDLHLSKAQHPSRARSFNRSVTTLEERNDRRVASIKTNNG